MYDFTSKPIESKTKDLVEKTHLGYFNNLAIRTISKTYHYRQIGVVPRGTNATCPEKLIAR